MHICSDFVEVHDIVRAFDLIGKQSRESREHDDAFDCFQLSKKRLFQTMGFEIGAGSYSLGSHLDFITHVVLPQFGCGMWVRELEWC